MRDAAIDTHRSPARGAGRSRTAGAPPLDDMVGEGPVSRGAPRRGGITSAAVAAQRLGGGRSPGAIARGRRGPGLAARLRARLPRVKPLKALTVAAFGVALIGIVANAMVFQRGHHPSPLFGFGRSLDGASDPSPRTAAVAPAPVAPATVEKTGTPPPPAPAAAVEPPPPAVAPAPKAAPPHHAAAKLRHEPAAKAKAGETAPAHPRPGRPTAAKAKAEPQAIAEPKGEPKPAAKADPVAKFLAGAAHPAKAETKPAHVTQPTRHPAAEAAAAPRAPSHHRVAATAPAKGAKPRAQAE